MKLTYSKLLKKNKSNILENVKQARQYFQSGKLTDEELRFLIEIDPTPTRKFVGWMTKQWVMKTVTDKDDLRNTIEEYNTFLNRGKAQTKDIYKFKTFQDLKNEVESINQSGEGLSSKQLEDKYETIIDNNDLLIVTPHTHEASRKLGLTHFSFRECEDGKDSAWCTTFKTPDHFEDYYYTQNITLYYIKVRSENLMNKLKEKFPDKFNKFSMVALAVHPSGKIDGYDGLDKIMSDAEIQTYTSILGIS